MAMDLGGAKGGVKADINVTPLVDVMLVLLIIMMLIAPMLQKGVPVTLPEAGNTTDKPETQDQTVVAITSDKKFFVNSIEIRQDEVAQRVRDALETAKEKVVLIKADQNAPYSAVMDAMDELRKAGIEDIGLVTEPKAKPGESGGQP